MQLGTKMDLFHCADCRSVRLEVYSRTALSTKLLGIAWLDWRELLSLTQTEELFDHKMCAPRANRSPERLTPVVQEVWLPVLRPRTHHPIGTLLVEVEVRPLVHV